jgi:diguanylate cyclase (GGDEF)-like protein/PAS domain S-box-containing protein
MPQDTRSDLGVVPQVMECGAARAVHLDPLTGLPDRQSFVWALDAALTDPDAALYAVLIVDLDHFKFVNDTVGHGAGDSLLVVAADRLRSNTPDAGMVARMGGDEFAVWMPVDRPAMAIALAESLRVVLDQPIAVAGVDNFTSASVGVVVAGPGRAAHHLIAEADTAMTTAKAAGGNGYAVFDDALREKMAERTSALRELNRAINHREIDLDVQPIIDLRDGSRSYEMLARWNHPTRGRLSPAAFIGLAEQSGLIGRLGHQILELGASHASALGARVSVNVSVRQFNRALTQQVASLIERFQLTPGQLVIEITESAVIDNEHAQGILDGLRRVGAHIWIDDFGTGYSSLSRLTSLKVDGLKLPREFIEDLDSPQGWGIAAAIVGIARALDIDVIAEGVETRHQLSQLRRLGCDAVQGYLLGRPRPFLQEQSSLITGAAPLPDWLQLGEPIDRPPSDHRDDDDAESSPATTPEAVTDGTTGSDASTNTGTSGVPGVPGDVEAAARLLWEHLPLGLLVVDTEASIRIASPRAGDLAGRPHTELIGRSLFEFLTPEDSTFIVAALARGLDFADSVLGPFRLRYRHRDGTLHGSEHWAFEAPAELGFAGYVVTMAHESTSDLLAAAFRDIALGLDLDGTLGRIADAMTAPPVEASGAMLRVEDGRVVSCLGAWPYAPGHALADARAPWSDVARGGCDRTVSVADLPAHLAEPAMLAGYESLWLRAVDHVGDRRAVLTVWYPMPGAPSPNHERHLDEAVAAAALAFGQHDHREHLRYAAMHDHLTGVGNRAKLADDAAALLVDIALYVDLDDLRVVNDQFGHAIGDLVLRTAAERITDIVGDRGAVYRVGGDEFGVLLFARPTMWRSSTMRTSPPPTSPPDSGPRTASPSSST